MVHTRRTALAGTSTTPPGATISSASSSIRCSVCRAAVDLLSSLNMEHVQSTMHASSSSSSSIRICAEDIALMHHSQAQQPHLHSRKDSLALTSTKQYDASALATTVTLFGPGTRSRSLGMQAYMTTCG